MKKLLAFVLCALMLLSLVSCDISSDDSDDEIPDVVVFDTENIKRITFYAYYGAGIGSDVPAENMEEMKAWLGTFTLDKKFKQSEPPAGGINTHQVEIEYLDGTIIKQGLDTVAVDGTVYWMKHSGRPTCFYDIISKTSLGE